MTCLGMYELPPLLRSLGRSRRHGCSQLPFVSIQQQQDGKMLGVHNKALQRIGRLEDQFRHAIAQLKPLSQKWYSVPEVRDYARPCPTRVESGRGSGANGFFSFSDVFIALSPYRARGISGLPIHHSLLEVGLWLKFSQTSYIFVKVHPRKPSSISTKTSK